MYDEKVFVKIAESMKQKQMKLFSVVNSEKEAMDIQSDLNGNGYQTKLEKKGSLYNIFYQPINHQQIPVTDDILKDHFKSLGDNRFQKTTAGVYDYSFDDGSIWELKTFENGEQYLVKTVNDDNEDEVIRVKRASRDNILTIEDEIEKQISNVLNRNKFIVSKQLIDNIKKDVIAKMINTSTVEEKIKEYCNQGSCLDGE